MLLIVCGTLPGQNLNPKPVKALGAPRLIATQANPLAIDTSNPNWIEGKEVYNPTGVAIDNSVNPPGIYVTDTRNNRVLGWRNNQVVPGTPADVVLGQANQYQTFVGGPGTSNAFGLSGPTGIVVDSLGNVYVADSNNNRIVRFPTPFAQGRPIRFFVRAAACRHCGGLPRRRSAGRPPHRALCTFATRGGARRYFLRHAASGRLCGPQRCISLQALCQSGCFQVDGLEPCGGGCRGVFLRLHRDTLGNPYGACSRQ